MSKKLYIGNLGYSVGNDDLEQRFAAYGTVVSAQVITDRETGRSKGFGFVEMDSDQEAQAAILALAGKSLWGRSVTVNEARPREGRSGGAFGRPRRGFDNQGAGGRY
ncbi:MAG: RNA-binding protein [Candidatus Accumulibacter sp. UW26]|jgi:cold-inducible RNA-binding protein